ncbi:MAG: hypothetical protein QXL94_09290, partial [Candidatus Parvarchaeum sp.]
RYCIHVYIMNLKLAFSIFLIAIFIYLIITNNSFLKYVSSSIQNMNTSLSVGSAMEFYNKTENMTKGAFLNWSLNKSNTNEVIEQVKAASGNTIENMIKIWNSIQGLKNATMYAVNKTDEIYSTLKNSLHNISG